MNATTECLRCSGNGRIVGFSHVVGGRCFACGGSGRVTLREQEAPTQRIVKPLQTKTFSFQGRTALVTNLNNCIKVEWNGGSLTLDLSGDIRQYTVGIPRDLRESLAQKAKEVWC